jgi:hypothetical protein
MIISLSLIRYQQLRQQIKNENRLTKLKETVEMRKEKRRKPKGDHRA